VLNGFGFLFLCVLWLWVVGVFLGLFLVVVVRLCIYLFAVSEQVLKDSLRFVVGFWLWLGGGFGFLFFCRGRLELVSVIS
jgi:hypothetical protein